MITMLLVMSTMAVTSANRIFEILKEEVDLKNSNKAIKTVKDGSIEFHSVSFSYVNKKEKECLKNIDIKIKSKEMEFEGSMYFMLVFNGQTAGGFKLAYQSDPSDGLLDVIIFKAISIRELLPLFVKVLRGEHLDSDNVIYFKTDNLEIECHEDIVTDIDGEKGPDFPLNIKCKKGALKVLGINQNIE